MQEKQQLLELNQDNYFSVQANMDYMSASQFKDFVECEKHALAKAKGEYVEETSKPMLVGSYVDAYFSNELEKFKAENPQIFKKDGTLLKDFEQANEIIKAIENDKLMSKMLNGRKQVIMTGEICGVPFKIKVDSLKDNYIVDQKVMASYKERVWVERNGYNTKVDFVNAYGYDIQGAIYQEIVRQNTGKKLPFVLAVATKEENPDKALIEIDQYWLDKALEFVKDRCERYDLIKKGLVEPSGCGCCPTCRKDLVCKEIVSYEQLFGLTREEDEQRNIE